MLTRGAMVVALLAAAAGAGAQQPRVEMRRAAPGLLGAILRRALDERVLLPYEAWNTRLRRDSTYDATVLVIGSDATVAATVHGDVIVVNGNLFLRDGAHIDGDAVAIGGGVYDARGAVVLGTRRSFRDDRFDIDRTPDRIVLTYRPPPTPASAGLLSLPEVHGLRVPVYTRVDGVSLSWGPRLEFGDGAVILDPTVTYRSDLGAFDPGAALDAALGGGWRFEASAQRGTFTNDAWALPDLPNSITVLAGGRDARNYWRGDRIDGRVSHSWRSAAGVVALWGGAATERDWSVPAGGPWSVGGQHAADGITRFNPPIERGRLSSALGGVSASYTAGDVTLRGDLSVERAFDAPAGERFTQGTIDAAVAFPTFGQQRFSLRAHAVVTGGDSTPPQRFAYLGGVQTLPTLRLLSEGGDRLVYIESAWMLPITAIRVRPLGAPVLMLHHAIGAAGVRGLPRLTQNLGVRVALGPMWVGWDVDPASHDQAVSFGLTAWSSR